VTTSEDLPCFHCTTTSAPEQPIERASVGMTMDNPALMDSGGYAARALREAGAKP
jgi:hypothetical protein